MSNSSPNFQPRPFLYTEVLLCLYVVSVVTLTASPMLHRYSNYIGMLMAFVFVMELITRTPLKNIKRLDLKPMIPFIVLAAFMVVQLPLFWAAQFRVQTYIQIVILLGIVYSVVRITGRTWFLEFAFLIGLLLLWRSGAWQISEAVEAGQRVSVDVTGTGYEGEGLNPNIYGLYLCTYLLFACRYAFVTFPQTMKNPWQWGRLGIHILGSLFAIQQVMMATGSRKAQILVLIIAAGMFFLITKGRLDPKKIMIGGCIALLALGGAIYTLKGSAHVERLMAAVEWVIGDRTQVREGSVEIREGMARTGIYLWTQSPIWGHGNEGFRAKAGFGTYSHSNPVELLANYGLIGLIVYYSFFFLLLKKTLPYMRTRNDYFRAHGIWILLAIGFILFWDLFAVSYYTKAIAILIGTTAGIVHHYTSYQGFAIGKRGQLPAPMPMMRPPMPSPYPARHPHAVAHGRRR